MELILIRHAEANAAAAYADDALRTLSSNGRLVHENVTRQLMINGLSPDVILCSPRIRSEQTAWIMSQVLPGEIPVVEIRELGGGFALEDFLNRLWDFVDCQSIACVGHEPDMTFWTNQLLTDDHAEIRGFATSGVVSIDFDEYCEAARGNCRYVFSPDDLLL